MIKELLLISALVGTPVVMSETTPTDPTPTETTTTTTSDFDWKAWLAQWFTPQQVAMIMTWIAYITTVITVVYKFYRMAKDKNLSNENLKTLIMTEIGSKVDSSVKEQITAIAIPLLQTSKNQEEVLKVLTKIMALSQENTPESRVAILDCIASLGVVDKQVLEQSKQAIDTQIKATEDKKIATQTAVDNVIQDTATTSDDGTQI
ncbi:MAG: hypothetical protein PHU32_05665 [Candidatus ainarchaeum sp.]|nr:hypothetical protein [Candidatus ainarchaeum sp.]